MDNFKLTVTFSDGEVVTETFVTEAGMERAIKAWKDIENDDRELGETYTIVSFEPEALAPENVEELV